MSSLVYFVFKICLAIAVHASALDVNPRVPVLGAGLDDLHAVGQEVVVHVVDEAGGGLAAVHHAGQAELAVLEGSRKAYACCPVANEEHDFQRFLDSDF